MATIKSIANILIRGEKAIVFPLKITYGPTVCDSAGNRILDIRGWGRFQYHDKGIDIQDALGAWVVQSLNEAYEKENA